MEKTLMYSIIVLFVLLLFVNIYFRLKVIRAFRKLKDNKINFDASNLFDSGKLSEIMSKNPPEIRQSIADFSKYLRYSISMVIALIVLITLFGAVLMYYRQHA
jgi:hypothetical protein